MRKRSDVKKAPAAERTIPMFEDKTPATEKRFSEEEPEHKDRWATPPAESKTVPRFYACPKCGLNQTEGQAKRGGRLACMSCNAGIDAMLVSLKYPECSTCGAKYTETSLGFFLPCGHGPKLEEALDRAEARIASADAAGALSPDEAQREYDKLPSRVGSVNKGSVNKEVEDDVAKETVTVVWGEEKFTPVANSYSTFTVGPFSVTLTLLPGETHRDAIVRGRKLLEEEAEMERMRKAASFIRALKGLKAEVTKS